MKILYRKLHILFFWIFVLCIICQNGFTAEHFTSTFVELNVAINTAQPGDEIVMENKTWENVAIHFSSRGTNENPITLRAETPGGVIISGYSTLNIDGIYLVVSGLQFANGTGLNDKTIIGVNGSYNRLTETAIINYNTGYKWVQISGYKNRVDHCRFEGKNTEAPTMQIEVPDKQADYHLIDHNHFAYRPPLGANGGETIRAGYSGQMDNISRTIFEYNLFERCNGENEIVSNKCCENLYRYNTFLHSEGQLCFRHGDRNIAYGNYFFGEGFSKTGGIRVIGSKNYIINNYFNGLDATNSTGSAVIVLQRGESYPAGETRFNPQIVGCTIAYNTIVNNTGPALSLNQGSRPIEPKNVVVANNIFKDPNDNVIGSMTGKETWIGNIADGQLGIPNPGGFTLIDPLIDIDDDRIFHLTSKSPAIDAGEDGWGSVIDISGLDVDVNVDYDFDGQARTAPRDVGCDEFASGTISNPVFSVDDVGPVYFREPSNGTQKTDLSSAILYQNYPNPVVQLTKIEYSLQFDSHVLLKILNILGQEVATLVSEDQEAGDQVADWDASRQGSGMYFYRLKVKAEGHPSFEKTRKMVLLK